MFKSVIKSLKAILVISTMIKLTLIFFFSKFYLILKFKNKKEANIKLI